MLARFPGSDAEHPDSSGYIMGLMETLLTDERVSRMIPFRLSDTPITMSRNRCIRAALDPKVNADYILMIDSDMSPDCEPGGVPFWDAAWNFMYKRRMSEELHVEAAKLNNFSVEQAREVAENTFPPATIAAPYCGPPPHECCYVFRWYSPASHDVDQGFKPMMVDRDDAAMRKGIEEVAALPTGLILYDARLFRKLPPPWFRYEWTDGYETHKASTEDVYQTRNASLMGFPQFCAWDSWAGHWKPKLVRKPQPLMVASLRKEWSEGIHRAARMGHGEPASESVACDHDGTKANDAKEIYSEWLNDYPNATAAWTCNGRPVYGSTCSEPVEQVDAYLKRVGADDEAS